MKIGAQVEIASVHSRERRRGGSLRQGLIGVASYAFESGTLKGRRCIWGGRAHRALF
jgi:hypothetical protein